MGKVLDVKSMMFASVLSILDLQWTAVEEQLLVEVDFVKEEPSFDV